MGGFVIQSASLNSKYSRPFPNKLLSLFKSEALPWPIMSDCDIKGRSRADWITKGIAIAQIVYFVTSLIGRWAQGLAITTLELFTLGIVFCAFVTVIASWNKPFDVHVPIVLFSEISLSKEDCVDRVDLGLTDVAAVPASWVRAGSFVTSVVFGALHVAAWNFYFPSPTERLLWRISSIWCMGLLCCQFAAMVVRDKFNKWSERVHFIMMTMYILVRTYMFVEMFVSLRAVPESVYRTPQWSQYFPFLG